MLAGCAAPPKLPPPMVLPEQSTAPVTEPRKSVIIYPDAFERAARSFAYLHREFGGAEAILVPLSDIEKAPLSTAGLRIPFDGWQYRHPRAVPIRGYDFDLAKKIIAYLRYLEQKENILAVTLIGDGGLIPPSYYFFVPFLEKIKVPDIPYNEWIASDLLYASPDFDLGHEWAVGRISVDTPEQALRVAEKYYRWSIGQREKGYQGLVFFAGNILEGLVYSGEMLFLLLEQDGFADWRTRHYFESDGRFTVDYLEQSMAEDSSSFHYFFTHGVGDGIEVRGDYLRSRDIARLPYKDGLPLVVSPSCLDGGFDYDLIDAPHDLDGYSIGEAILRSPGAGIGYLGSTRIALGEFHYAMKEGELDPHSMFFRYMPGLLVDFFDAYHDGHRRIGEAFVEAHLRYRQRFGITEPRDFATFVEVTLLADPVLLLPPPPVGKQAVEKIEHLELYTLHDTAKRMPQVKLGQSVTYGLHRDSPHRRASVIIIDAHSGNLLHIERTSGSQRLIFKPEDARIHMIRIDFDDGTVSWQFLQVVS